jgi:hypothetical protein
MGHPSFPVGSFYNFEFGQSKRLKRDTSDARAIYVDNLPGPPGYDCCSSDLESHHGGPAIS